MRPIDADELLMHIQDYGHGQERLDLIDPYYVRNAPTIEMSAAMRDEAMEELTSWRIREEMSRRGRPTIILNGERLFLTQGHIDAMLKYEQEQNIKEVIERLSGLEAENETTLL